MSAARLRRERDRAPARARRRDFGGNRHLASSQTSATGSSPRERGTLHGPQVRCCIGRFIPARAGNAPSRRSTGSWAAVHPRASGERTSGSVRSPPVSGSSPGERGTRQHPDTRQGSARFIPARAGNAPPDRGGHGASPVHPRASGERGNTLTLAKGVHGSSPRERGTLLRTGGGHGASPVHPRASGERIRLELARRVVHGSSPRERGTPGGQRAAGRRDRFIPARAGNARSSAMYRLLFAVHPRASGERMRPAVREKLSSGSSPRERGTPTAPQRRLYGTAVHPRASGERVETIIGPWRTIGSSPRERGTHREVVGLGPVSRFIPARAGNARKAAQLRDGGIGSSPRERGTLVGRALCLRRLRFIPARAGNAESAQNGPIHHSVHPRASGERSPGEFEADDFGGSSPRERGTPPVGSRII